MSCTRLPTLGVDFAVLFTVFRPAPNRGVSADFAAGHRQFGGKAIGRIDDAILVDIKDKLVKVIGHIRTAPALLKALGADGIKHAVLQFGLVFPVTAEAGLRGGIRRVGVDIEQYGERVCRVASRFINDDERISGVWKQLLLWSAKETVYKMMNCCEVDFQEHLISGCWRPQEISGPGCQGFMRMQTFHPAHRKAYQVYFETTERFVLTYSFVMDY